MEQLTIFDVCTTVSPERLKKDRSEHVKRHRKVSGKCVNCGATENLEEHHIVPLSKGGTNNPQNLITLCHTCHMMAHGNVNRTRVRSNLGGRPRRKATEKEAHAFLDYIEGRKTGPEMCEIVGTNHINKKTGIIRDCMERLCVEDFRNNMAIILKRRGWIDEGDVVGWYIRDGIRHTVRSNRRWNSHE